VMSLQMKRYKKSHECGFIFILCHKNYRKTTFNSGIPHAKFAMTNNTHDIIEIPRWHWRNRGNPYTTYVVSNIFIPPPDTTARSPDSTGQIFLVFLYTNILHWW
jgi:hypothetical protein